jgi:hypothetical protein
VNTPRRTIVAIVAATALATTAVTANATSDLFSDVPSNHPHHQGITWAEKAGVVKGYPDGTFRPDAPVTRGQLSTMLYRYHAAFIVEIGDSVTIENPDWVDYCNEYPLGFPCNGRTEPPDWGIHPPPDN